jgi:hypothetical protein
MILQKSFFTLKTTPALPQIARNVLRFIFNRIIQTPIFSLFFATTLLNYQKLVILKSTRSKI